MEKEIEAFAKMLNFYNELKDLLKYFTKMLKEKNNDTNKIKILISILAINAKLFDLTKI